MTSDLIDRQAALDIINAELNGWLTDDERLHLEGVGTGIECLPAVDPVKHGKWEKNGKVSFYWECSECGALLFWRKAEYFLREQDEPNYCPNCGARMDGE